ncbi:MAG: glycosyltransferase family 2 protein [Anaerolineales bacterium]|nr:glycosyltransferase family 2 protein [Chloroflexota bacterium]MBL6980827.1 glycosyltransferase family 2 protein [Anaerolineales bacterium]
MNLEDYQITVVIPAYNVERQVDAIIRSLPAFVKHVIVVNDASTDTTSQVIERVAKDDPRVILLQHKTNQGVGGAMVSGFIKALELSSQVIVKMDGDGQMSAEDLPLLITPLISGDADYTKGNRFRDLKTLKNMPIVRLWGNTALSFLVKAATGYWECLDPSNGFLAIRGDVLEKITLEKIHHSYFFEISMLSQLYMIDAYVMDIPLKTRYGDEKSHMSIIQILSEYPGQLGKVLVRRILLKKFLYDFSMDSIYILFGLPMVIFGGAFGLVNWIRYHRIGVGAPTGTIMIAVLILILGFQMLFSAINIDLQNVPKSPINKGEQGT